MAFRELSGWGRTAWSSGDLVRCRAAGDVRHSIDALIPDVAAGTDSRGAIARGMGRAYGAAAQNSGGTVLEVCDPHGSDGVTLDDETGILDAPASTTLDSILRISVPRGWFVPVTPGTRLITVGGAIASDVHGKNHHLDGSFCDHVLSLDVALSTGELVTLTPGDHPEWFWATAGGMGLTGTIVRARVRMLQIGSPMMKVETQRAASLEGLLELMSDEADDMHRYSVAWIDLLATKNRLGRGVLTRGDHAARGDVPDRKNRYTTGVRLAAPPWAPSWMLSKPTIAAFNEMWFRKAPRRATVSLESIPAFFHPLDAVRNWNRLYGRAGFIQYQFILPFGKEEELRRVVELFAGGSVASFLAVLKRMGKSNAGPLSFPRPGWTLAVDLPARQRTLIELLPRIDELVLAAGGRHYLAKDSHVGRDAVTRAYPELARWQSVQREMDPIGMWQSDLSRRLGLVEHEVSGAS